MALFDAISFDLKLLCRAIGFFGFALHVYGFISLSTGRIDSQGTSYFLLKLVASACVLVSLFVDFNFNSALIQVFYIAIAIGAVVVRQAPAPTPIPVSVEPDHRHATTA